MPRQTARVQLAQYTTGSYAAVSPTWVDIPKRDLSLTASADRIDLAASEKVNVYGHGPIDLAVSGTMPTDNGQAAYDALQAAHAAGTVLGFRFLDVASGDGWHFNGIVTRFDQGGGRSDANLTQIEIVPAPDATDAPVYQAAS